MENQYSPETTLPPGEIILDYLDSFEWSQSELARRTGITPKTISEICNGKAPITANTALAFERVLNRPAHFWLNLQRLYDEAEARKRAEVNVGEWTEWAKKFPIVEMKKFGWFEREVSSTSAVEGLLDFFGVSSPDSWKNVWAATNVAYRQTKRFRTSFESISAWVRATELAANDLESEVELLEFDDLRLRSSLEDLRNQTKQLPEEFVSNVQSLCAAAGVLVVWVPELKLTGISGCARWLTEKKALIALTLRYKSNDHMWFTFFHEVGHILLHRKEKRFILDNVYTNLADQIVDPPMQAREEEANRFAAVTLIPPDDLFLFILEADFSAKAVRDFAEKIGVGPGIVVGRLQHDGYIPRNHLNEFKVRFEWKSES